MLQLGLKDRKLLYWLDQNSRATNKELGKKVGLTEQAIGYKIKRLQEEGVIKKFVTFVNTLSLGYQHYKIFVKLYNHTEEIEQKIIAFLVKHSNVRWVVSTSGKYDLNFSILAKNTLELSKIYQEIESKFGNYIIEKNILINIQSPGFSREWILDGKQSKKIEYKSSEEVQRLDEVDKKILSAMSQNARKNVVDIAQELHSTVDVVRYRLAKLKDNKIINGFTIQLDLEKLGYEYYSIFFHTHNFTDAVYQRIIAFAQSYPNVLFVVSLIGNYDLQLELEVKNHAQLEAILRDFRHDFSENIRDFEVLRVTKEYKYDFYPF